MAKLLNKNKFFIWFAASLSLLAVVVTAVSTAAWFQLDRAPVTTSMVSGSPDLNISQITGYKVEHTVGAHGDDTFTPSSIVSRVSTGTGVEITENDDLEGANTNYDIPDLGDGYYLLKKNSDDAFKYTRTYTAGSVSSRNYLKFSKIDSTNNLYVTDTFAANQIIRLQKYTNINNTTINKQLKVSSLSGSSTSAELNNNDIKILVAGTYTIWIQTGNMSSSGTPTSYYVSNVLLERTNSGKTLLPKGSTHISRAGAVTGTVYLELGSNWGSASAYYTIHYWGGNTSSSWPGVNFNNNAAASGNKTVISATWDTTSTHCIIVRWNDSGHTDEGNRWSYFDGNSFTAGQYNYFNSTSWDSCNSSYRYKITVSSNGNGSVSLSSSNGTISGTTGYITKNQSYTISATPSSGYAFTKWSDNNTNSSRTITATADKTYAATFSQNNPSTSKTFYLYDPNHTYSNGVLPCAYFWDSSGEYYTLPYESAPTMSLVSGHSALYTIDSYTEYDYVIFCQSNNKSNKTTDILVNNSYNAYDVSSGTWYTADPSSTSTYYVYDPNGYLGTSTPYAYAWTTDKYIVSNTAVPGNQMSSAASVNGTTPDVARLYSIAINDGNTGFLFNDGTVDNGALTCKTEDLSTSGNAGKVYVITGGTGAALTGVWTNGVDCFYLSVDPGVITYQSGTGWTDVTITRNAASETVLSSISRFQISTGFYKVYMKAESGIQFRNANDSNNNYNWTAPYDLTTRTTNYLYIENTQGGGNRNIVCKTSASSSLGTATIYVSTNGGSTFVPTVMSDGDLTYNNFIYELGLEIPVGAIIYVQFGASTYYKWDQLISADKSIGYLAEAASYNNIQTTGYTGSARFNFYITSSGTLSIRMVPYLGNGFYVMPYYDSSSGTYPSNQQTEGFINAIKMSSVSNNYATYSGFYAHDGDLFFIRSYIDAVDTLCSAITINGASAQAYGGKAGVIQFNSDDYYTIEVIGTSVTISTYTHDNFFQLGPLNTSSAGTQSAVNNQYTSLVLEVEFTLEQQNSFDLTLSLEASIPESLRSYVGVNFYFGSVGGVNPYTYMRNNYGGTNLKAYANLASVPTYSIAKGTSSSTVLHAYIIMDYVAGSLNSMPAYISDSLSFKLVTSYTHS